MPKIIIYTGLRCAHCDWAKELLKKKNINFIEYNIATDPVRREEMFKKSNGARTVPQIFIDEKHIGGNVELQAFEHNGKLDQILKD